MARQKQTPQPLTDEMGTTRVLYALLVSESDLLPADLIPEDAGVMSVTLTHEPSEAAAQRSGDWQFTVLIGPGGKPVGVAVLPTKWEDVEALSSRKMREFPFGRMFDHAAAFAQSAGEREGRLTWTPPDFTKRPGRRKREDVEYAGLAARYVEVLASGGRTEDLARELNLSAKQVRSLLTEARRRKLLTAAPPGRAGGQLTPKALELLKEASDAKH